MPKTKILYTVFFCSICQNQYIYAYCQYNRVEKQRNIQYGTSSIGNKNVPLLIFKQLGKYTEKYGTITKA